VQEVASVDDHVRVVEFPFVMVVGDAESDAVGAGPLSVTVSVTVFVPVVVKDLLAVAADPKIDPFSLHE